MPQITGKAIIKVDGNQWRTTDGCKLHPGGVEPGGPFFDPQKTDFHPFYLSEGRAVEAHALHTLSRKEVEHLGR